MQIAMVLLSCVLWEATGYPYYPYYGNIDTLAYGASDNSRGGMVLNRYYNPYYTPQVGGGMAAFMFKQPEQAQPSQYYLPDKRRQTSAQQSYPQQPNYAQTPQEPNFYPPQQENEVFYPRVPEKPTQAPTEVTDIADPTAKTEVLSTTSKTIVPELLEPEVEEVEEKPRKVTKKKQPKRPVLDEEEDDEQPRMPGGTFFPMFFGWGRNSGGAPGGATAIANAYSTGRGGVATSHATAYGIPTPDFRNFKNYKNFQQQE